MATQTSTTVKGNQQSQDTLSVLLQELMSGGTKDMQAQLAARLSQVNQTNALRARYSPEAALADSQGLMAQKLREAMESQLPTITRSAEGAGSSASSMRALLTQDALTRAAQASSALGVDAVQGYGGIGASLSGTLEALTRQDNGGINAILQAIELMQAGNSEQTVEGGAGGGGSSGGGGARPITGGSSALGMPSTDSFFYRPGGILDSAAQQRAQRPQVYGPAVSDSAIADKIIAGLGPSQPLSGVPNINALYRNSYSF